MTSQTELHTSLTISDQLQSLAMYSDTLHTGLCRLYNVALPLISMPPHMLPLCLFVCLFTLVPQCHVLLALFVPLPDCFCC